jgi:hypothetical protein
LIKVLIILLFSVTCFSQDDFDFSELELLEESDTKDLSIEDLGKSIESKPTLEVSEREELDELEELRSDIGEEIKKELTDTLEVNIDDNSFSSEIKIIDVSEDEKKLMSEIDLIKAKMSDDEWNSLISKSTKEKYVVKEGDYLWRISQTLFGSGFYYAKIWSLNPQITNPHEIEPGMTLVFESGDENLVPTVKVSEFKEFGNFKKSAGKRTDLQEFGDDTVPAWLSEREKLKADGAYFQFLSEDDFDDFDNMAKLKLNEEFRKYAPPRRDILVPPPADEYDEVGFDRNAKINFNYKEGFYLNTFVSTNIVQDFGVIHAARSEPSLIRPYDKIFIHFDKSVDVKAGDRFSVYKPEGKVSHEVSDRNGFRYSIVAQVQALRKLKNLWECEVIELTGEARRGDRVTVYTPKIDKIIKTFNDRAIEAAIIDSYKDLAKNMIYGDIVYLDRGRADGVEIGNVFEVFSFYDRGTGKRISKEPTYKIGELTVISMTDDFSTALVTNSSDEINLGYLAFTKSSFDAAKDSSLGKLEKAQTSSDILGLENLDVEVGVDDLSAEVLKSAENIRLTDDEIEELERQELEKSILNDHEKDLRDLERLEQEIVEAEQKMLEAKLDEDKILEDQSLDELEGETKVSKDPNDFAALDEIEEEVGRQYMDEDINNKDNPFGLTEFDLEELDELMNTDL